MHLTKSKEKLHSMLPATFAAREVSCNIISKKFYEIISWYCSNVVDVGNDFIVVVVLII